MNAALPRQLASYIHETGLRALDHLADGITPAAEGAEPDALQTLVGHWRAMTPEQKEDFVDRVAVSVGEVIAASALLPVGVKVGKKVVKSARKVLKKSAKTLKKKVGTDDGAKKKKSKKDDDKKKKRKKKKS